MKYSSPVLVLEKLPRGFDTRQLLLFLDSELLLLLEDLVGLLGETLIHLERGLQPGIESQGNVIVSLCSFQLLEPAPALDAPSAHWIIETR